MSWIKIADHVVLSGSGTVSDSPTVEIGASPMIQIAVVSHSIAGASASLGAQPQTTDDPSDTPIANGSDSAITTATTTRITRVLQSVPYGHLVRVRCTLSGTTPTVTISV